MKILILIFTVSIITFSIKANTLDEVKDRGYLICGVSEGLIGFAVSVQWHPGGVFNEF